jgi:hypothetical protein
MFLLVYTFIIRQLPSSPSPSLVIPSIVVLFRNHVGYRPYPSKALPGFFQGLEILVRCLAIAIKCETAEEASLILQTLSWNAAPDPPLGVRSCS